MTRPRCRAVALLAAAVALSTVALAGCTRTVDGMSTAGAAGAGPAASASSAASSSTVAPNGVGVLPADGATTVGGVRLHGHRVFATDSRNRAVGPPRFWVSDQKYDDIGRVWRALDARRDETGLYPLALTTHSVDGVWWRPGYLIPVPGDAPQADPGSTLRRLYAQQRTLYDEPGLPSGALPLPLTRLSGPDDGSTAGEAVSKLDASYLALVVTPRPADAPYLMGWSGPANYFDTATATTVLRSWEDRFRARVVSLDVDEAVLAVPDPPKTLAQARRIAAEHYAFSPDEMTQGDYADLDAYAASLVGNTVWEFWWD